MVADTKKCQTMINAAADELENIRAALVRLQVVSGKFSAANPSLTGTALYGKKTALVEGLAALQAAADLEVWTDLIEAKVPSHRGEALDG